MTRTPGPDINVGTPKKAFCVLSRGDLGYGLPVEPFLPQFWGENSLPVFDFFDPTYSATTVYRISVEHVGHFLDLLDGCAPPQPEDKTLVLETLCESMPACAESLRRDPGKNASSESHSADDLRKAVFAFSGYEWPREKSNVGKLPLHLAFYNLIRWYLAEVVPRFCREVKYQIMALAASCWIEGVIPLCMASYILKPLFVEIQGGQFVMFKGFDFDFAMEDTKKGEFVWRHENMLDNAAFRTSFYRDVKGKDLWKAAPTKLDRFCHMPVCAPLKPDVAEAEKVVTMTKKVISTDHALAFLQSVAIAAFRNIVSVKNIHFADKEELAERPCDETMDEILKVNRRYFERLFRPPHRTDITAADVVATGPGFKLNSGDDKFGYIAVAPKSQTNAKDKGKSASNGTQATVFLVKGKSVGRALLASVYGNDDDDDDDAIFNTCLKYLNEAQVCNDTCHTYEQYLLYGYWSRFNKSGFTEFCNLSLPDEQYGVKNFEDVDKVQYEVTMTMETFPLVLPAFYLILRQTVMCTLASMQLVVSQVKGWKNDEQALEKGLRALFSMNKQFIPVKLPKEDEGGSVNSMQLQCGVNNVKLKGRAFNRHFGSRLQSLVKTSNYWLDQDHIAKAYRLGQLSNHYRPKEMVRALANSNNSNCNLVRMTFVNERNLIFPHADVVKNRFAYVHSPVFAYATMRTHKSPDAGGATHHCLKLAMSKSGEGYYFVQMFFNNFWTSEYVRGSSAAMRFVAGKRTAEDDLNSIAENLTALASGIGKPQLRVSVINAEYGHLTGEQYNRLIELLTDAKVIIHEDEQPAHMTRGDATTISEYSSDDVDAATVPNKKARFDHHFDPRSVMKKLHQHSDDSSGELVIDDTGSHGDGEYARTTSFSLAD